MGKQITITVDWFTFQFITSALSHFNAASKLGTIEQKKMLFLCVTQNIDLK